MGAALGTALRAKGESVLWASSGRSATTAARAGQAGLVDVVTLEELARLSEVILAVCPPYAAVDLARSMPSFGGVYIDANAVSPRTALTIAGLVNRYVDGGIIGPPPRTFGTTRLYLSGDEAPLIVDLFAETIVETRVVSTDTAAASAVKMAFAAWTKGTSALLLAIRAVARAQGVEETLLDEWRTSLPQLIGRACGRPGGGFACLVSPDCVHQRLGLHDRGFVRLIGFQVGVVPFLRVSHGEQIDRGAQVGADCRLDLAPESPDFVGGVEVRVRPQRPSKVVVPGRVPVLQVGAVLLVASHHDRDRPEALRELLHPGDDLGPLSDQSLPVRVSLP
jgi:hypothetical protein